jgi:hypothetical protein
MNRTVADLKRSVIRYAGFASLFAVFFLDGCGYTTRSLLPANFKTIYVENVANKINVTAEQSNLRMYRGYRPGMEIELTKAIINRYLFDGNLKIAPEGKADLVLKAELIDYKRDALRYDANDNVTEYRIKMIINMELFDAKTGNSVWKEKGFAGETTYMTTGPLAKTDATAVGYAMEDLARRVVERTIEAW